MKRFDGKIVITVASSGIGEGSRTAAERVVEGLIANETEIVIAEGSSLHALELARTDRKAPYALLVELRDRSLKRSRMPWHALGGNPAPASNENDKARADPRRLRTHSRFSNLSSLDRNAIITWTTTAPARALASV
jgi:hypothetical protein